MHKFLVIRLYFPLDALHVSDVSGGTFISCTSHLVYAGTIRLAVVWLWPHNSSFMHMELITLSPMVNAHELSGLLKNCISSHNVIMIVITLTINNDFFPHITLTASSL